MMSSELPSLSLRSHDSIQAESSSLSLPSPLSSPLSSSSPASASKRRRLNPPVGNNPRRHRPVRAEEAASSSRPSRAERDREDTAEEDAEMSETEATQARRKEQEERSALLPDGGDGGGTSGVAHCHLGGGCGDDNEDDDSGGGENASLAGRRPQPLPRDESPLDGIPGGGAGGRGAGTGAGTETGPGAGSVGRGRLERVPSVAGSGAYFVHAPPERRGDYPTLSVGPGGESMLPLSMQLMRPFWVLACCHDCGAPGGGGFGGAGIGRNGSFGNGGANAGGTRLVGGASFPSVRGSESMDQEHERNNGDDDDDFVVGSAAQNGGGGSIGNGLRRLGSNRSLQSLPLAVSTYRPAGSTERLIQQYVSACHLYGCHDRINAGVLTTLRFSLPALRTSGSFHDADMLALCEVLLEHGNGAMSYVRRLDFSISSREGKLHGKRGFRSHGAYALGKVLQTNRHVQEVFLQWNRIGPYGSSALFLAAANNPVLRTLVMRRCRIMERGALAFAQHLGKSECGLTEVDISVNQIGFRGCLEVEEALVRARRKGKRIEVDLEGNLVLQEIMNSITHGLGILLCIIGTILLINRVKHKPSRYVVSCSVYSASLLVLYTSSTLYHSFFALTMVRYIFGVLDKCAIYLLIAGSYTPYLRIALANQPMWDVWLLFFIWACCVSGLTVEIFLPQWKHRANFSLAMYLGMGWCCMVCLPDLIAVLPQGAINLLVLGGVGYTSGVPFFVRNNNLDHSIWHCFVLAGSMFHWFGVFSFVCLL